MSEHDEQAAVIAWAARVVTRLPELELLYAVPNGGWRPGGGGGRLKAEGVKSGVPDLCLPVARHGQHGLYLEMKKVGGKLSEAQKDWIGKLRAAGYSAEVCIGAGEAVERIEVYLGVPLDMRTQWLT